MDDGMVDGGRPSGDATLEESKSVTPVNRTLFNRFPSERILGLTTLVAIYGYGLSYALWEGFYSHLGLTVEAVNGSYTVTAIRLTVGGTLYLGLVLCIISIPIAALLRIWEFVISIAVLLYMYGKAIGEFFHGLWRDRTTLLNDPKLLVAPQYRAPFVDMSHDRKRVLKVRAKTLSLARLSTLIPVLSVAAFAGANILYWAAPVAFGERWSFVGFFDGAIVIVSLILCRLPSPLPILISSTGLLLLGILGAHAVGQYEGDVLYYRGNVSDYVRTLGVQPLYVEIDSPPASLGLKVNKARSYVLLGDGEQTYTLFDCVSKKVIRFPNTKVDLTVRYDAPYGQCTEDASPRRTK